MMAQQSVLLRPQHSHNNKRFVSHLIPRSSSRACIIPWVVTLWRKDFFLNLPVIYNLSPHVSIAISSPREAATPPTFSQAPPRLLFQHLGPHVLAGHSPRVCSHHHFHLCCPRMRTSQFPARKEFSNILIMSCAQGDPGVPSHLSGLHSFLTYGQLVARGQTLVQEEGQVWPRV